MDLFQELSPVRRAIDGAIWVVGQPWGMACRKELIRTFAREKRILTAKRTKTHETPGKMDGSDAYAAAAMR